MLTIKTAVVSKNSLLNCQKSFLNKVLKKRQRIRISVKKIVGDK